MSGSVIKRLTHTYSAVTHQKSEYMSVLGHCEPGPSPCGQRSCLKSSIYGRSEAPGMPVNPGYAPLSVREKRKCINAVSTPLSVRVRGLVGTLFSRERCAAPGFAPIPANARHLLLFHRRLDGDLRTTRGNVPVKIRCQSEQTLSVGRDRRAGSIVNAIT